MAYLPKMTFLPGVYSPPDAIPHVEIPLKGNDEEEIVALIESDAEDSTEKLWNKFNQMLRDNDARIVEEVDG